MKTKKKSRSPHSKAPVDAQKNVHVPTAKKAPKTLENMRLKDATFLSLSNPDELSIAIDNDEFASHFCGEYPPHIIVTTTRRAHKKTLAFATEFSAIFGPPSSDCSLSRSRMLPRQGYHTIDVVIKEAIEAKATDLIVVGERLKEPYSLTLIHLPNGPTAYFRLSSVISSKELGKHCGSATSHPPELNMANFDTMLGLTVGRFLTALFPFKPQFEGRQIVTFHNQRDFIFFRRHRYIFQGVSGGEQSAMASSSPSVRMQELGPRFTLKLMALQRGTFDRTNGEYIWIRSNAKMNTRKQFYC